MDILVLDLHLPGRFDGFSLCEALRKDPRHKGLVVVVVSGYADPDDRIHAARLNVNRYFLKPVDVWMLAKVVDSFVEDQEFQLGSPNSFASQATVQCAG